MNFSAPPGFFEYVEITRFAPPRMPALPPPSNSGNGTTSNLPFVALARFAVA